MKGEETAFNRAVGGDKTHAQVQQAILTECDAMLDLPPVERIKIGRRLLVKSREALRRIFALSYAWQTTKQDKYLKRAEAELLAVSAFSDWNPTHFLDVGEMTMATAIGYDWLCADLSAASRATIKEAILTKGLQPSLDASYNSWIDTPESASKISGRKNAYPFLAA